MPCITMRMAINPDRGRLIAHETFLLRRMACKTLTETLACLRRVADGERVGHAGRGDHQQEREEDCGEEVHQVAQAHRA